MTDKKQDDTLAFYHQLQPRFLAVSIDNGPSGGCAVSFEFGAPNNIEAIKIANGVKGIEAHAACSDALYLWESYEDGLKPIPARPETDDLAWWQVVNRPTEGFQVYAQRCTPGQYVAVIEDVGAVSPIFGIGGSREEALADGSWAPDDILCGSKLTTLRCSDAIFEMNGGHDGCWVPILLLRRDHDFPDRAVYGNPEIVAVRAITPGHHEEASPH